MIIRRKTPGVSTIFCSVRRRRIVWLMFVAYLLLPMPGRSASNNHKPFGVLLSQPLVSISGYYDSLRLWSLLFSTKMVVLYLLMGWKSEARPTLLLLMTLKPLSLSSIDLFLPFSGLNNSLTIMYCATFSLLYERLLWPWKVVSADVSSLDLVGLFFGYQLPAK